ncbi:MAG: nucleotidyltransferase domain-containing protein [Candidatus Woesearchaeota archaeon]|nr:nucleotidyltransferase domain-containing protein [Candidatus Woesearchaeota archaeon]
MGSKSKEEHILRLILEESPLKEWHFAEIYTKAHATKAVVNKWLKKYVAQGLLQHIKEKGTFPFFTVGANNPTYNSLKRLYALEQLHRSGLITELLSLQATIVIFGSIVRGDWYKESDIDIFIFGNAQDFDKQAYEQKLQRNIELHIFQTKEEIHDIRTGLIKNVVNGYVVKGQVQDFAEVA